MSRVLITVPSLRQEFGGPVVKVHRLAAALRGLGLDVTVVGVGPSADGAVGLPPLGRFHATPVPARVSPLRTLARQADVVHVVGYRDPVGTLAALVAGRSRVPYVWEPAGMHRRRLRSVRLKGAFDGLVGARLLRRASAVIATSELEASELKADGVPPGLIRVRPNGVDVDELLPLPPRGALRQSLRIPAGAAVVLSLGRITAKKGLLDLARALVGLPDTWAVVAGPDDGDGTVQRLRAAQAELGLEQRLAVLTDGLWGKDRAQAFADADVFCLPSATENFGNAALEAAAVGLPVVISDACGASEFLDPTARRIVPHGDHAALAGALSEVLQDSVLRRGAAAAQIRLRQTLDWKTIATAQRVIYEALVTTRLDQSPPPAPPAPATATDP